MIHVPILAGYFTTLTHLPALTGGEVLQASIAKGVERGLFAYALGDAKEKEFDTILFKEKGVAISQCEITDSAWLILPKLAATLLPEPIATVGEMSGGKTEGGTVDKPQDDAGDDDLWGGNETAGVKIVDGERRLNRVRIQMRIPWENWHDIYNEVIDPLAKEGAEIVCDVTILAKSESAIRENTIELGIKESLSQRDIKANIETN